MQPIAGWRHFLGVSSIQARSVEWAARGFADGPQDSGTRNDGRDALGAEAVLIEAARGDPAAFEALYAAHYHSVAQYLYRRTGDAAIAEELAGQTLASAWKGLGRFRTGVAPMRCWLLRIATNELRLWRRGVRRAQSRAEGWAERARSMGRDGPGSDDVGEALAALQAVPRKYREALSLFYLAELPAEQVGLVMGRPTGTVKSLLSRGRALLRCELERRAAGEQRRSQA